EGGAVRRGVELTGPVHLGELRVVGRRGVDEPALAVGVRAEGDDAARLQPHFIIGQRRDLERRALQGLELVRGGAGGGPVRDGGLDDRRQGVGGQQGDTRWGGGGGAGRHGLRQAAARELDVDEEVELAQEPRQTHL